MPDPMMILDERIVPARWRFVDELPEGAAPEPETAIPLAAWLQRDEHGADLSRVGVRVEGWDDLAPLEARLSRVPMVALHLPKFSDGRCYSHARRLRALWGFEGPIVAFGDVLQDQIVYLWRCGVNGFQVRPDQDLRRCLRAFRLYTRFYQYNDGRGAAPGSRGAQ